ncbi:MAG: hypothetical protein JO048_05830 [Methylobacteriaceae bacterium]|nr:hypothetical protein [Methylobacteriaceae bacterium]
MLRRLLDWLFRDRATGQYVVAQWPNLSLSLFGVCALIAIVGAGTPLALWAEIASRVCLVWWAADELLRGVNPWRRCLGAAILIWLGLQAFA